MNHEYHELAKAFYAKLKESVMKRVQNIPDYCKSCSRQNHKSSIKFDESHQYVAKNRCEHAKVAILFSGGVDSAVLAALVDQCLPPNDPIDLLNVAFEMKINTKGNVTNAGNNKSGNKAFLVPDRISGLECLKELNANRKWNFVQIDITYIYIVCFLGK